MNLNRAREGRRNCRCRAEVDVFKTDDQNIATGRRHAGVDVEVVILRSSPVRKQRHVTDTGVADCLTDDKVVRADSIAFSNENVVARSTGCNREARESINRGDVQTRVV